MRRLWIAFITFGLTVFICNLVAAQDNGSSSNAANSNNILIIYLCILSVLLLAGWVITAIIQYCAISSLKKQQQITGTCLESETKKRAQAQQTVLEISEREQLRIGHELHDGVLHDLTALGLAGDMWIKELAHDSPEAAEKLKGFIQVVDQSAVKLRDLAKGLSPVHIGDMGICGAVEQLAKQISRLSGVTCECEWKEAVQIQDQDQALHLYRIIQEAVNNAVRHSHAKRITIQIQEKNNVIEAAVHDNGKGFNPSRNGHNGMGIHIMQYRAEIAQAGFHIHSEQNKGTTVSVSIPQPVRA